MRRSVFLSVFIIFLSSCADKKENQSISRTDESVHPPYDTIAIDSFSAGAISVDVAAQIRRSSIAYQDSVKREIEKAQAEKEAKLMAEEKAKMEKEAAKKKAETKPAEEPANSPRSEKTLEQTN